MIASSAEWVAATLRQRGGVMLIGERTAGAFSPIFMGDIKSRKPYEGGIFDFRDKQKRIIMKVTIGTGEYRFKSEEVEGQGLIPDKIIFTNDSISPVKEAIRLLKTDQVRNQRPAPISCN